MDQTKKLTITSKAFEDGGKIPVKYSCNGENINPPLHIGDLPNSTLSLAIIAEDPDAPHGTFIHWLAWNLPPHFIVDENSKQGLCGKNGSGEKKYTGPCPPSGTHRYFFKVYALDDMIDLSTDSPREDLEKIIEKHILAEGELMGTFSKEG